MAATKSDSYYHAHYLDMPLDDGESYDYESDIEQPSAVRNRAQYAERYHDEITELYSCFMKSGRKLFGSAFFQAGGMHDFAEFVYRHTRPFP